MRPGKRIKMNWSYKIARIAGTDVKIHLTFPLLLGFIALANLSQGVVAAAMGVLFVILVFGCVLLHEFGHIFAARAFGVRTPDVTLYPIGGVARLERMPEKPGQELIVALAGPAVNVVIAGLLTVFLMVLGLGVNLTGLGGFASGGFAFLGSLAAVNIWLVLFNLIPAFPMDGGRVLRALLAMRMPFARATNIAAKVGRTLALVAGFYGLFTFQPMLMLIAVFVYFAAGQEAMMANLRERDRGFFRTDSPRPLDPDEGFGWRPGSGAARGQTVPVLDEDGRLIGWVRR